MNEKIAQLLAAAQLAEMHHKADLKNPHKQEKWEKALLEYQEAVMAYIADQPKTEETAPEKTDIEILNAVITELDQAYQTKQAELEKLADQLDAVENEKKLLKNQLIEKDKEIEALQKSLVSANSPAPVVPPVPATRPLTGAAKVAADKKAAEQAASAETDETKKNS